MTKPSGKKLDLPPFPPLTWDRSSWRGRITLSSWRGFQLRSDPYASESGTDPSDGTVMLSVKRGGKDVERPPSAEQAAALRYLLENEAAIQDTLVAAIFEAYVGSRDRYLADGFLEDSEMPVLTRGAGQLRSHVGLSIVHIRHLAKDGAAYVGFEFGCTWEVEHGLGVMMHQGRILTYPPMGVTEVGYADQATLDELAEEDAKGPDPAAEETAARFEGDEEVPARPLRVMKSPELVCSFCGHSKDEVGRLIQHTDTDDVTTCICGPCVDRFQASFAKTPEPRPFRLCTSCVKLVPIQLKKCPFCGSKK
jgi:hypothetical protein